MLQPAIERQAAMIIADLTEEFTQTVEPVGEEQILLLQLGNRNYN